MSFELPYTEKDYYVFTAYPEICDRAIESGLDNFVYYPNDAFNEDVLDAVRKKHKIIVKLHPSTDEPGAIHTIEPIFPDSDLCFATFNPFGKFLLDDDDEGKQISTIDEVSEHLLYFVDFIEFRLQMNGVTYKCANCHRMFMNGDKYCRVCGTERGKGTYLPYENQAWILYGAPIKKRYKCGACGHIWISSQWDSHFCPECGKDAVKHINAGSFLIRMLGDYCGREEPYDSDKNPILISEEQVKIIMEERHPIREYDFFSFRPNQEIYFVMEKAGIEDFEIKVSDRFEWTDKGSDQLNLVRTLLFTEGDNPYAYENAVCPHCGSKMIAGICYDIKAGGEVVEKKVHMPSEKDPVTYYDPWNQVINLSYEGPVKDRPAYMCMQCGDYFGKFSLPKWQMWKYRRMLKT